MHFIEKIKSGLTKLKILKNFKDKGIGDNSIKLIEYKDEVKFEMIYQPKTATYSGHHLKIIPTEPSFEPSIQQQYEALHQLISFFKNNEIKSLLTKQIEFVDQGENLDSVSCNFCGTMIDIEYWSEAVNISSQNLFSDLTFQTPCCNKLTNLNDLNYDMPAGFSKYQLIVIDPEYEDYYQNDQVINLQKILGVQIRLIWCHY